MDEKDKEFDALFERIDYGPMVAPRVTVSELVELKRLNVGSTRHLGVLVWVTDLHEFINPQDYL